MLSVAAREDGCLRLIAIALSRSPHHVDPPSPFLVIFSVLDPVASSNGSVTVASSVDSQLSVRMPPSRDETHVADESDDDSSVTSVSDASTDDASDDSEYNSKDESDGDTDDEDTVVGSSVGKPNSDPASPSVSLSLLGEGVPTGSARAEDPKALFVPRAALDRLGEFEATFMSVLMLFESSCLFPRCATPSSLCSAVPLSSPAELSFA